MSAIDYYFTCSSPWSYLGHDAFVEMARRLDRQIRWRPMRLPDVFSQTGGLPVGQRAPARQHYRLIELQRWRARRGLPLNLKPAHWPTDPSFADLAAIASIETGHDPAEFISRTFRALWAEERDIASEEVVGQLLDAAGIDAKPILLAARAPDTAALYQRYTREAMDGGIFGAPAYVLNGEVFWGQDRLELLEDAVVDGRRPYHT